MAGSEIAPCISTVDATAITALVQSLGVSTSPPLVRDGQNITICREAWDQWVRDKGLTGRFPSYVDLFRAQENDDNPASLSREDLLRDEVRAATCEEAEVDFVKQNGYPEAIVLEATTDTGQSLSSNSRRFLRMKDGSYWVLSREGKAAGGRETGKPMPDFVFRRIPRAQGRELEAELANNVLRDLASLFDRADPMTRLQMKSTMGAKENSPESSGGRKVMFGGKEYLLGNRNSRIAYAVVGSVAKYHLSQPQNGCVAASILNGAIFSGAIVKDDTVLENFYTKLKVVVGSADGRVTLEGLAAAIDDGRIPGLSMRRIERSQVADLVGANKPVIAIVPYFIRHGFLVLSVDSAKGTYRAVDTVTGIVVEEDLELPRPAEKGSEAPDACKGKSDPLKDRACMRQMLEKVARDPEFQLFMSEITGTAKRTFYSIEITNPVGFLAWVNAPSAQ